MDIANSTITTLTTANIPHAAQEARRDSINREVIPEINQTAKSLYGQATSQGNAQLAPANANLYIQADSLLKVSQEKKNQSKNTHKSDKSEAEKVETKQKSINSTATVNVPTITGQTIGSNVNAANGIKAVLSGAYGKTGASFSDEAENKKNKGNGYSSKVIAKTYNNIRPNYNLGSGIDDFG